MIPASHKTDFLGEKLHDVDFPCGFNSRKRGDGVLHPGDLVDIHQMLSDGKKTAEIAEKYCCSVDELETFILRHRDVNILRCAPGRFTGDNVIRPSYRNGTS